MKYFCKFIIIIVPKLKLKFLYWPAGAQAEVRAKSKSVTMLASVYCLRPSSRPQLSQPPHSAWLYCPLLAGEILARNIGEIWAMREERRVRWWGGANTSPVAALPAEKVNRIFAGWRKEIVGEFLIFVFYF